MLRLVERTPRPKALRPAARDALRVSGRTPHRVPLQIRQHSYQGLRIRVGLCIRQPYPARGDLYPHRDLQQCIRRRAVACFVCLFTKKFRGIVRTPATVVLNAVGIRSPLVVQAQGVMLSLLYSVFFL